MDQDEQERILEDARERITTHKSIRAMCKRADYLSEELGEQWIAEGIDIFEARRRACAIQERTNNQQPLGRPTPIFKDELEAQRRRLLESQNDWEPLIKNRNY